MGSGSTAVGPLKGLRILDIGTIFAGPLIGAHLGDLGADVIKIEPLRGDDVRRLGGVKNGVALWWKLVARNKRLAAIDLTRPEGSEIVRRLVADADVLVENYRPGKLESWGLAYERLAAINPRLVVLHISGYGRTGPYRNRPGFGTLAEAFSGFAYTNGQPNGPPTLPNFPIADSVTALVGCYTVLAALRERDLSGRGQEVELDLYESLLGLMGNMVLDHDQLGVVMQRRGNRSNTSVPRNAYPTRDRRWVVLSSTTDAMASRVFRAIGRDDWANDPSLASNVQRSKRVDEIDGAVAAWVAERTQAEALQHLLACDVPAGPINDIAQFVDDPHVRARGTLTTVQDPDLGELRMQNVVPRFSRTPGRVRWAGRAAIGPDTREIVREAGYSDAEIDQMASDQVIRMP